MVGTVSDEKRLEVVRARARGSDRESYSASGSSSFGEGLAKSRYVGREQVEECRGRRRGEEGRRDDGRRVYERRAELRHGRCWRRRGEWSRMGNRRKKEMSKYVCMMSDGCFVVSLRIFAAAAAAVLVAGRRKAGEGRGRRGGGGPAAVTKRGREAP